MSIVITLYDNKHTVTDSNSYHPIPYPWQQTIWSRIIRPIQQGKAPHALLLSGQKGVGKFHLANVLADYLLCSAPQSDLACGHCRSCQLLQSGTHPDKQVFQPEEGAKQIKVDQIRQLGAFVNQTAQQGGRKVVILEPVELLNINAANALLKNLEEPAGDTTLILVTHVPSAVMATIRSRCQVMAMATPPKDIALKWLNELQAPDGEALLALAGGAPLLVKDMLEGDYLTHLQLFLSTLAELAESRTTVVSAAQTWLSLELGQLIEWWLQIIHAILSRPHESEPTDSETEGLGVLINPLVVAGSRYPQQWLFKFSDKLVRLRQQQLNGANPNMQLLIEELLMDWLAMVQKGKS